jgi:prephenate dehydratase
VEWYAARQMKVAIQGELGSFSHVAAERMLPRGHVVPCTTLKDVFDRVTRKQVDCAVVPIENSLAGSVAEHYDLLVTHDLFAQREFLLRIEHNLIVAPGAKFGAKLQNVRRVFSHPVALEQCREFIRAHPHMQPVPFYDTAGSVAHVIREKMTDAAGIASRRAAQVYGGRILRSGLEDNKQNYTRFFLLRRDQKVLAGANKTSIAFALKNIPGALFKALSVFALRDINLSKIESRPIQGRPWEYVFFVDYLRGRDEAARKALGHLEEIADFVKVLGIYPAAK